jgi:divalent metal cation (Fe/Co/Zn/Cd) transporter
LLAVVLLASSIVLMPALGWAKHRLGERLSSAATAGEGTQNLLCAAQGAVALIGMLLGSAGPGFLDPAAALGIAAIATREGAELWRGDTCGCTAMPELEPPGAGCGAEGCDCC